MFILSKNSLITFLFEFNNFYAVNIKLKKYNFCGTCKTMHNIRNSEFITMIMKVIRYK